MKQSKKALKACLGLKMRCGMGPTDLLDTAWLNATGSHLTSAISTGFVGYHMLVSSCGCLNAYGFDTAVGGHYWDRKHRADRSHNMGPEHTVIKTTCAKSPTIPDVPTESSTELTEPTEPQPALETLITPKTGADVEREDDTEDAPQ